MKNYEFTLNLSGTELVFWIEGSNTKNAKLNFEATIKQAMQNSTQKELQAQYEGGRYVG